MQHGDYSKEVYAIFVEWQMVTDYGDHFVMCKNIEQLCCVPESINSSVVGQLYFRKHKRDQILVTEGGGGGIE